MDSAYLCLLREEMGKNWFSEIASVTIEQGEEIVLSDEERLRREARAKRLENQAPIFFTRGDGTTIQLVNYADIDKPQKELRYHLRTNWARNTGIFFRAKERGLLVQLDYDESDVTGHVNGYWKLRLYFQFQPVGELRKTGTDIRKIPFLTTRQVGLVHQFHLVGKGRESPLRMCYRYDQTPHGQTLAPDTLAQNVKTVTDGVLQFLRPEPFTSTDTKDFPPHYVFAGCESLFWQKFDESSRRNIIAVSEESLLGSPRVLEQTPILATQHA